MHIINVTVRDKIATHVGDAYYVCGNSDFVVQFDFDDEWAALDVKTARFIREDGAHYDKVFSGSECPVPIISNTNNIRVGVFAGNLCTTTPARVPAVKSILCPGGTPAAPEDDTYNQIMAALNENAEAAKDTAENLDALKASTPDWYIIRLAYDGGKWTVDRTYADILKAMNAGKTPVVLGSSGKVYQCSTINNSAIVFSRVYHPGAVPATQYGLWQESVKISADDVAELGVITPVTTPNPYALTIKQGGNTYAYNGKAAVTVELKEAVYLVTVTASDGGYTADRSREEIAEAVEAGAAVLLRMGDSVYTYAGSYGFARTIYDTYAGVVYHDRVTVEADGTASFVSYGPDAIIPVDGQMQAGYLRWNGMEYVPVSVDDVKAELGVQDEGEYELIEDVPLDGVASTERTEEPDGTPYAFTDILVEYYLSDQSNVAGHVYTNLYADGALACQYGTGNAIANAAKRYATVGASIEKGSVVTFATEPGMSPDSLTTLKRKPVTHVGAKHITKVRASASVTFPPGSKMTIKGVRANA